MSEMEPLAGHGDPCPLCKSPLQTKEVKKDGPRKGQRFLSCSGYPACKHTRWPEEAVDPLPNDGKECPECGAGHLRTRAFTAKTGKRYVVLSCDGYPACKHSEWS